MLEKTILQLNRLSRECYIHLELFWIKAHAGHSKNEEVDKLAKEAIDLSVISHAPLPRSQVRSQVLDTLRDSWVEQWHEYDEARHSKLFITGPDKSRGKEICALNRVDLRHIIMAISNHNNLNYHRNVQDDTINPTCRFCRLFDESFDHFFTCIYFHADRVRLNIRWPFSDSSPWTVEQILEFINSTAIKDILDHRKLEIVRTESSEEPMEIVEDSDSSSEPGDPLSE